jgi:hypothetical protein
MIGQVLNISGILGSQPADRGPIEILAALGEQAQESVVQQASERQNLRRPLRIGGGHSVCERMVMQ